MPIGKGAKAWVTLRVTTAGDHLPSDLAIIGQATTFRWEAEKQAIQDHVKERPGAAKLEWSSHGTRHATVPLAEGAYVSYIAVPVVE